MEVAIMSINNIWKEVMSQIQVKGNPPEKAEKGFYTASELAKMLNVSGSTMKEKVRAGATQGIFELKKFRIKSGNTIKLVNHYKIKK